MGGAEVGDRGEGVGGDALRAVVRVAAAHGGAPRVADLHADPVVVRREGQVGVELAALEEEAEFERALAEAVGAGDPGAGAAGGVRVGAGRIRGGPGADAHPVAHPLDHAPVGEPAVGRDEAARAAAPGLDGPFAVEAGEERLGGPFGDDAEAVEAEGVGAGGVEGAAAEQEPEVVAVGDGAQVHGAHHAVALLELAVVAARVEVGRRADADLRLEDGQRAVVVRPDARLELLRPLGPVLGLVPFRRGEGQRGAAVGAGLHEARAGVGLARQIPGVVEHQVAQVGGEDRVGGLLAHVARHDAQRPAPAELGEHRRAVEEGALVRVLERDQDGLFGQLAALAVERADVLDPDRVVARVAQRREVLPQAGDRRELAVGVGQRGDALVGERQEAVGRPLRHGLRAEDAVAGAPVEAVDRAAEGDEEAGEADQQQPGADVAVALLGHGARPVAAVADAGGGRGGGGGRGCVLLVGFFAHCAFVRMEGRCGRAAGVSRACPTSCPVA